MSTIRHLDPTIRRARSDRKSILQSLSRILPRLPSLLGRLAAGVTLDQLIMIRNDSSRTGEEKQRAFTNIINRLQGNAPAATEAA